MANIPKIRFKGFTGKWEQRKLGNVATFSKGCGYSKNDLINAGTPIILYGRLYTMYETVISNINTFVKEQPSSIFSSGGEVIVPASGETAADIARASVVRNSNVLLGGDLNIIIPEISISPIFLALTISNGNVKKELAKKAQGKSIVHIHNQDLKEINILFPISNEQQRIGAFFEKIDTLINKNQYKLESLQKFKKAMLQKMFPKAGSSQPEIRFKGFTGAWEQRKLGDEMTVTSVKRILQSDWTSEGIRFLRARDIVSAYKNEQPTDYLYISKEKYEEYSALSGKVAIGDMLVTGVGTIGIPYLISNSKPVYFKDGNIIWFQNKQKIDGSFFYYSFCGKAIQQFVKNSAGIGTVGTYTIESGKKTPISLPSKDEQKAIGAFFSNLDNFITLHQRKLDSLQKLKKAMLQKMFA